MVKFEVINAKDCMGFKRRIYRIPSVERSYYKFLAQFGEIKIYKFKKELVKIKSKTYEISTITFSNRITVTYRNKVTAIHDQSFFEQKLLEFEPVEKYCFDGSN